MWSQLTLRSYLLYHEQEMCEEISASKEEEHAYSADTSQETPPEAVWRADESTGKVLTKYHNIYLYYDIL